MKNTISLIAMTVLTACGRADLPAAAGAGQASPARTAFHDVLFSGKHGFIDRHGAVVIAPKFDRAWDLHDGYALVERGGRFSFIDATGAITATLPAGSSTQHVSEGRVWYQERGGRGWTLASEHGAVIARTAYDRVQPFSQGLAAVNVGAKMMNHGGWIGGKWGYVDRTGKLVIPIQYEFARSFSDGLAQVQDAAGDKYIDRAGRVVIAARPEMGGSFRDGLAAVRVVRPGAPIRWVTHYIDRHGKTAFTVDGYGEEFHEGRAVVSVPDARNPTESRAGYIDRAGKFVIAAKFAAAQPFSGGLAAARLPAEADSKDATWGYIDAAGKWRIAPFYNEAQPFRGGVARVHAGGQHIHMLHAPATWRGGTWWLIDTTGRRLKRT